jgi:kynureninase
MASMTQTASELDSADPLKHLREEFLFPATNGEPDVYFVGNSLGLQPKGTQDSLQQTLDHWRHLGVHGHFESYANSPAWMDLPERLSSGMSGLVGAEPDEVVVMNTLTVNLHLMMATFYQPTSKRFKVLIEDHAFPSDYQAVASHVGMRGFAAEEAIINARPREGSFLFDEDSLVAAIRENRDELALVLLPGIQYYTGQVLPMERLVSMAREYEIPIGLDLAHAAGNIPLSLSQWGPDFACWCTYKYMNCGPGALGGCYIRSDHAASQQLPRMAGWWGHERRTRFAMEPNFVPERSAQGWQLSNPPILAMAAMTPALQLFEKAGGMDPLRAKSLKLNAFLRERLATRLAGKVRVVTPDDPDQSGCQLSLEIVDSDRPGKEVFEQISRHGIHTDWREPNVIRAAPVPLYNSFADVDRFVTVLAACLDVSSS